MVTDPEDLRDRVVGKRFYDTANEEALTVVGLEGDLLLVQYDDGIAWDEQASPELLDDGLQMMLGVSEGGIDDERYIPLGAGPRLDEACAEDEHAWSPTPADLGWDDRDLWYSTPNEVALCNHYARFVRCTKCGLSGMTLSTFLGHHIPDICDRCGDELLPGVDDWELEPTMEWRDATLCTDCASAARENFGPSIVSCFRCGDELGAEREQEPIPGSSMIGTELDADDDETLFLCSGCRSAVQEEII